MMPARLWNTGRLLAITVVLFNFALIGCVSADGTIQPVVNKQAFPGFEFSQGISNRNRNLSGYQYQTIKGDTVDIHSCQQARDMDSAAIPEFEYFRFQQLLLSCQAMERFGKARVSDTTYFPASLDLKFFQQLPASAAPLLSKADRDQRKGKSFMAYDKNTRVTMEDEFTAKLLSDDDEIYITLLARGDFTGDGIEDLLVKSEWYARNAFGKHLDLLVLTRTDDRQAARIDWRMQPFEPAP